MLRYCYTRHSGSPGRVLNVRGAPYKKAKFRERFRGKEKWVCLLQSLRFVGGLCHKVNGVMGWTFSQQHCIHSLLKCQHLKSVIIRVYDPNRDLHVAPKRLPATMHGLKITYSCDTIFIQVWSFHLSLDDHKSKARYCAAVEIARVPLLPRTLHIGRTCSQLNTHSPKLRIKHFNYTVQQWRILKFFPLFSTIPIWRFRVRFSPCSVAGLRRRKRTTKAKKCIERCKL